MGKLDGKVAVITGSGRGIGKATAELFSTEGCAVVINDIDEVVASATTKGIEAAGGKVAYCVASVASGDEAQKLMDTAVESFGQLDILVNCAGIAMDAPLHKMTDQQWDMVVDISLKGTFNAIRAAAKHMRKENHNGRIINISSMAALKGGATQINYVSAKGGIIAMTKVVAHEWERFGITCNCVAYGPVDTRITRDQASQDEVVAGHKVGIPTKGREALLERYGGKLMTPEDAARPILYFALPESWCINGNCLQVAMGGFV